MDPPSRSLMTQRIHCVNCNICVNACNTFRRHVVLHLDPRVVSLISNWIFPIIITEEDYICEACYDLSRRTVNAKLHENAGYDRCAGASHQGHTGAGLSRQGHTQVCLICGRSLVNRQSHLVLRENSSDFTQRVIQIIENRIAPRQITASDRTCHACWMKSSRDAIRNEEVDNRRHVDEIAVPVVQNIPDQPRSPEMVQHGDQEPLLDENVADDPPDPDADHEQPIPALPNNIELPNYRRGPNTAAHCLFYGCDRLDHLHTVSDPLRITVLRNNNYYIPTLSRVCSEHLRQNNWDHLYEAENSIATFTAEQVEHIFSFVNPVKQFLDFTSLQSVQQIDDHLFVYWMGIAKENFLLLLDDLPRILETNRGLLGLAALLIKMRTGDSVERISTLLEVPRTTLERLMARVREILLQDFVPRNLGLNHLTREELLQHNLTTPNGIYNEKITNKQSSSSMGHIFT